MKILNTKTLTLALAACGALLAGLAGAATAPAVTNLPSVTDQIGTPVRLTHDTSGNFYLTDPRAGGVLVFGNDGRLLRKITTLKKPQGIAVTAAGDLVVSQGSSVSVLSQAGVEKFKLGVGAGQFKMANGIAIDSGGSIYVVDSLDNCVQVFTSQGAPVALQNAASGKPVNSFGSAGKGSGQFSQPTAIAYEPTGNQLAVVDTLNSRVQFFTTSGSFVKSIGGPGLGSLKFGSPQGIAFGAGSSGSIMYVADAFQSNVQAIDLTTGSFLRVIGSYGKGSGKLVVPTDLVFDGFDSRNPRLVVANGFGNLTLFGVEVPASTPQTGQGPALSVDTVPLATNLTSLTLSGTVAANATVRISVNTAAVVGSVTGGVNWSAPVTGLVVGNNQFTVTATDTSGNSTSTSVTVFVSAASGGAPVTPLTVTPLPGVTASAAQTLSGTVQPGSTVTVNGSAAAVLGGNWSFAATLSQGVNSFTIKATNASFSDAVAGINITLNSVAPLLDVALLPAGATTSSQLYTISGTVTDSLPTTVTVRINGQALPAVPVVGGSFSSAVFLAVGSNSIEVQAADGVGNLSATVRSSVNFVPSAPLISIAVADGSSTSSAQLTITGAASPGSQVQVSVAGTSVPVTVSGTSWSAPVTLAPGSSTILASATLGGLTSSARSSISYDPGAPSLAISTPAQNAVLTAGSGTVSVSGTTLPGANLLATLDGASIAVSVTSNGSFSVPLGNLGIGSHTLALTSIDALGNSSSALRTIMVADPTPPLVTFDSATPLKLTVASGATLVVRDKNGPVTGVVSTVNGVTTLDLSGASFDAATLNITAVTPTGGSTRNGVLSASGIAGQSGIPNISDALEALKIATGARPAGILEKMHGDVAPLANGTPIPDGKIDIEDVVVIMMRVIGKPW